MKEIFAELGKYLRDKRKLKGMSQSDVAKKLGYSNPQFISNFERGLCAPPLKKLKILIGLYDLPKKELMKLMLDLQERHLKKQLFDEE